jgi:4-amino-4-deoxy-L-arabinose transferase-like glycosyltransferase
VLDTIRGTRRARGASAVEYALLVALIAALIVAVVFLIGRRVFDDPCDTDAREAKATEACAPKR